MGLLRELLKKETLINKLLSVVDDYEIYSTLIGRDIEIGECISSPIRSSDDFPSFAIYIPTRIPDIRADALWFKDLADGRYGDVIKFCKLYAMHNYGLSLESSYDVVKFIDSEMSLGIFDGNLKVDRERVKRDYHDGSRISKDLVYKTRKYTNRDKDYWSKLFVETQDLEFFNIHSVQYLLTPEGIPRKEFRKNELAFVYKIWDKDKIYQPEAPKAFKFRNTCPGDDYRYYQGFQQLTGKEDVLIITKSMKDCVVFWKFFNKFLNINVGVVAPPAESIILSPEFVELIKKVYKDKLIICVSDYDLAGIKFAQQCKKHGFAYKFISTVRVLVNNKYKVIDKDISDFVWNNGYEETIKLLKSWNVIPKKENVLSVLSILA